MSEAEVKLRASLPDWVAIESVSAESLVIRASPRNPSGLPGRSYILKVNFQGGLAVREALGLEQPLLPLFCPERHINGDQTFCLGLVRFKAEPEDLAVFWAQLRAYLLCQDYASRQGSWPTGRWLSHGEAADWQIKAEDAAQRAGLTERYRKALEFGKGCLAGDKLKSPLLSADRPVSQRKLAILDLIDAEMRRRNAEIDFTKVMYEYGRHCCNTMRKCPLRDISGVNRSSGSDINSSVS